MQRTVENLIIIPPHFTSTCMFRHINTLSFECFAPVTNIPNGQIFGYLHKTVQFYKKSRPKFVGIFRHIVILFSPQCMSLCPVSKFRNILWRLKSLDLNCQTGSLV